jgi:REP element-mobilizing transposase RayT
MKRCAVQLELHIPTHGGARKGAGKKPEGPRPRVSHATRATFRSGDVLHVTLSLREGIPSLRQLGAWAVIVAALRAVRGRADFRVVQLSVQTNHLHLLIEADDAAALADAMRSLGTRLGKRLNKLFGRKGRLFEDRYHVRALTTPREARNVLAYVLLNARKHAAEAGHTLAPHWVDPYSSARAFDGWAGPIRVDHLEADCGTSPATTWLLVEGWRKHPRIAIDEVPGGARAAKRGKRWPVIPDAWGIDRARDAA